MYDFVDDFGSRATEGEANFGIVRHDYSHKPAFAVLRRVNNLLDSCEPDFSTSIAVTKAELQRAQIRSELIKDWDGISIDAGNGITALCFKNPNNPSMRWLAVWSDLPYSEEFNNRIVNLKISGLKEYTAVPIAVNLINGDCFDAPLQAIGGDLLINNLSLTDDPLLIQLSKR